MPGCFTHEGFSLSRRLRPFRWREITAAGDSLLHLCFWVTLTSASYQIPDFPTFRTTSKMSSVPLRLTSNPQSHKAFSLGYICSTRTHASTTPPPVCYREFVSVTVVTLYPQDSFLMTVAFYSQVTVIASVFINIHVPFPSRIKGF